jgi:hypothetical protein
MNKLTGAEEEKEIPRELYKLQEEVSNLRDSISKLSMILEPICKSIPEPPESTAPDPMYKTGIGQRIASSREFIDSSRFTVEKLIASIEL